MHSIYTIGHSRHSPEDFVDLLRRLQITALADVRSHPHSKFMPHFCKEELRSLLATNGIRYVFLGDALGARPSDQSCYVGGRASYELIARTPAFAEGISRLMAGREKYRIALMCAERDPIDCHRAILVAHALAQAGAHIWHIHSDGSTESHETLQVRLLDTLGLNTDMFQDGKSNLEKAFKLRGDQIAFEPEDD